MTLDPTWRKRDIEDRKATTAALQADRERLDALLKAAEDSDEDEGAYEWVIHNLTVGDFLAAAAELRTARNALTAATTLNAQAQAYAKKMAPHPKDWADLQDAWLTFEAAKAVYDQAGRANTFGVGEEEHDAE